MYATNDIPQRNEDPGERDLGGPGGRQDEEPAGRLNPDITEAGRLEGDAELRRIALDLDDRELAAVGHSPHRPIADDRRMVVGA